MSADPNSVDDLAKVAGGGGAGGAAGPALGGVLVDHGGWRWAFWINLPLGLVALLVGTTQASIRSVCL